MLIKSLGNVCQRPQLLIYPSEPFLLFILICLSHAPQLQSILKAGHSCWNHPAAPLEEPAAHHLRSPTALITAPFLIIQSYSAFTPRHFMLRDSQMFSESIKYFDTERASSTYRISSYQVYKYTLWGRALISACYFLPPELSDFLFFKLNHSNVTNPLI